MRAWAAALLLVAASSRALDLPRGPREASLDTLKTFLDHGLWNDRITALYALGDWGPEGLPLLAYASDDADWQVRLTVVHFLGKLGAPAAPALGAVVGEEPCRHVRLSALQWLRGMGPEGERVYRAHAAPEDERDLAYLPDEARRMGKPMVVDAPGGMTASFFNGAVDFRTCASSERSGRRARALESPAAPEIAAAKPMAPPAPIAARPPAPSRSELDGLLALGKPQTLPSAPGLDPRPAPRPPAAPAVEPPERAGPEPSPLDSPLKLDKEDMPRGGRGLDPRAESVPAPAAREAAPARPGAPASELRSPLPGRKETMPPGAPGLHREETKPSAEAVLEADAGTGRVEADPVPSLIAQLRLRDARRRARAADELGKRGSAALPAVPALRRALADRDRRVRASAALALGNVGAGVKGVPQDLERALKDRDVDVRFSARIALDRLGAVR